MQPRIDFRTAAPDAYQAVFALESYVRQSGVDKGLLHLIKLRASYLNGCAYCVDMHARDALKDGHTQQWINMIAVWDESPLFSQEERAVLAWTDALTFIAQSRAPDKDFEAMRRFFDEAQITRISVAIATINVWNRLVVSSRSLHPIEQAAAA